MKDWLLILWFIVSLLAMLILFVDWLECRKRFLRAQKEYEIFLEQQKRQSDLRRGG